MLIFNMEKPLVEQKRKHIKVKCHINTINVGMGQNSKVSMETDSSSSRDEVPYVAGKAGLIMPHLKP